MSKTRNSVDVTGAKVATGTQTQRNQQDGRTQDRRVDPPWAAALDDRLEAHFAAAGNSIGNGFEKTADVIQAGFSSMGETMAGGFSETRETIKAAVIANSSEHTETRSLIERSLKDTSPSAMQVIITAVTAIATFLITWLNIRPVVMTNYDAAGNVSHVTEMTTTAPPALIAAFAGLAVGVVVFCILRNGKFFARKEKQPITSAPAPAHPVAAPAGVVAAVN